MILKMGHLAQSGDVRSTRLERNVPLMIEAAILASLTPLQTFIDTLTMRVDACERRHEATFDVPTLKDEAADDVDAPKTSGIPLDTIGDAHQDEPVVEKSDVKTDEEQIGVQEENIFRDLPDLAGTILKISLAETSMAVSSEVIAYEVISGTDAHVQTAAPDTESQTDGETA
uniref:Polyprotein protein n=1 Tax=Solanum tuberosum TaxID=4113 RepID=M1DNC0_SOLTU